MNQLGVILLAAGQGTRMKSAVPKVLHSLGGKALFLHVLENARRLDPAIIAIVVGHAARSVQDAGPAKDINWAIQEEQLGTGHAVLCAQDKFHEFAGDILILSGDVPLIQEQTLRTMIEHQRSSRADLSFLTAQLDNPNGYGRILRDAEGAVTGIIEEKDATDEQRQISEINTGIYVVSSPFLFDALAAVKNHNQQKEYYLTDIVAIALRQKKKVEAVQINDVRETLGINSREDLAKMEKSLRDKINQKWMLAGVTLQDPDTTYIEETVTIGQDTIIGPNTHLKGKTVIGERCHIDGTAFLTDMEIGDDVLLKFSVVMTGSRIDGGAIVGPFAHLRPGTHLGRNVHIGNFVEAKAAHVGEGTKANHLTYLGDVTIGRDTNIGAGTITCNYDGFGKYRTVIGEGAFIGSNTALVAPVSVGEGAIVGAGSVITRDVDADSLAVERNEQKGIAGWARRFRERMTRKAAE